jgi:nicotinamide-nucleotide amidase
MRGMLADTLIPVLAKRAGSAGRVVRSRTLRTTGVAESALADLVSDLVAGMPDLSTAYLPGAAGVDLRLTTRASPPETADALLAHAGDRLRDRIGQAVYGEALADLAVVVVDLCRGHGLRVAVAESCTGGLLGARITAVPGSSAVFLGGIIAYANEVKTELLGVSHADLEQHGAVSEVVSRQMAAGARQRFGADIGIAITGVAGPDGGSSEKPVGTVWVALDVPDRTIAFVRRYPGDRAEIRERAAQAALDTARLMLVAVDQPRGP